MGPIIILIRGCSFRCVAGRKCHLVITVRLRPLVVIRLERFGIALNRFRPEVLLITCLLGLLSGSFLARITAWRCLSCFSKVLVEFAES